MKTTQPIAELVRAARLVLVWLSNPTLLSSRNKTRNLTRIRSSRHLAIRRRTGRCAIRSGPIRTSRARIRSAAPLEGPAARQSWQRLVRCAVCLAVIATAFPVLAQSGQNIAGNYRGLLTQCLAAPQPVACRKGLTELVRLAEDVDARRAEWELVAVDRGNASADRRHGDYAAALDKLNRGVVIFNRDMEGVSSATQ